MMHSHSLESWQHEHVFLGERHEHNERRTLLVVGLTAATMIVEIVGGTVFGSMALVADGWHMSTHAAALGIAVFAYRFARHHAHDDRFTFGTGKFGELAGYSSALILAMIAVFIGYESVLRMFQPVTIHYAEASAIAVLGLFVNLGSAWLLQDEHHHEHKHETDDGAYHHHDHDHNLRSAYMHVLADAFTSVLAITALLFGWGYGWTWMDALVGIAGAVVIGNWSVGLLRSSGAVLLDAIPNAELARAIRQRIEVGGDRCADLHLWRLGPGHAGVVLSIVSDEPRPPAFYKTRLDGLGGLSHVTVEVHGCSH
jgi:cation diffusion facilitator family transporter